MTSDGRVTGRFGADGIFPSDPASSCSSAPPGDLAEQNGDRVRHPPDGGAQRWLCRQHRLQLRLGLRDVEVVA